MSSVIFSIKKCITLHTNFWLLTNRRFGIGNVVEHINIRVSIYC